MQLWLLVMACYSSNRFPNIAK